MVQNKPLENIYPHTLNIFHKKTCQKLADVLPRDIEPQEFPEFIQTVARQYGLPGYLDDLAAVEFKRYQALLSATEFSAHPKETCLNPTLSVVHVGWRGLPHLLEENQTGPKEPEPGEEYLLIWQHPRSGAVHVRPATSEQLLALKIVVENLDKRELARKENVTLAYLDTAIELASADGILLKPPSKLIRCEPHRTDGHGSQEKFMAAQVFTLQCHITQACDLNCRHCYDRSSRKSLSLSEAKQVFDQLYDFCQSKGVYGQVSFSGGNPLLHPDFFDIYSEAARRGFMTAILGNPTTPEILEKIKAIQEPEFYQVSLEGMPDHNDYIRGKGFFNRVMHFLDELRATGIYSMVMLTLTRDNLDQVLPLAELLRGRVDLFTFNRLSMVGEGSRLLTPEKEEFATFLHKYLETGKNNPVMGLKDNLINIIRHREGEKLFGGCAGYGCGAAFNFIALLPDGEVHACRKFNSPIGNIHHQSIADIYASRKAETYRQGPSECRGCPIRHVCGGCLAVIDSRGLDISRDRDPCCFLPQT